MVSAPYSCPRRSISHAICFSVMPVLMYFLVISLMTFSAICWAFVIFSISFSVFTIRNSSMKFWTGFSVIFLSSFFDALYRSTDTDSLSNPRF